MHTSAATPQKNFYEEKLYYIFPGVPENFVHHMQVHRNQGKCCIFYLMPICVYIPRRTKNATQNFQAPQERYNKLFLRKKCWGCGCTCMHSGFLINGYYTITPPQKVT